MNAHYSRYNVVVINFYSSQRLSLYVVVYIYISIYIYAHTETIAYKLLLPLI